MGMSSSTLKFSIQFLSCCSTLLWGFHLHSFLRFPLSRKRDLPSTAGQAGAAEVCTSPSVALLRVEEGRIDIPHSN